MLNGVDELHPGLHHLAAELERWLRTSCQINRYASRTSTEGFGTRWDDHDAVVVQLDGTKRWRLYGPTRTHPCTATSRHPNRQRAAVQGVHHSGGSLRRRPDPCVWRLHLERLQQQAVRHPDPAGSRVPRRRSRPPPARRPTPAVHRPSRPDRPGPRRPRRSR
ncbi:JmjC domain-containing protein [Streptacidiphilus fuscans]|uniref:JmjC domain-containing protein n=1 Tax=Streptacidiphilus fuscans TaxID=2789292 RepID=UPI002E285CA3|nr:cupin domain-containing protein [Streptacidiphilus fuscans]